MKATVNGVTTYYVGNHYEVKNGVVSKYYFAGSTRLAVRTNGTLSFLLADHIGSASLTTDANGVTIGESLYKAFGESRFSVGTLNTDYQFTGQRVEASLGIYWFSSRWMDPSLGRFTQPDSMVPTSTQGTQAWDRYAFVNNNPVRYNDPTGHCPMCVGAVLGAAFGAATYLITSAASGRSFNGGDFAASVAVGAVGGFLIGTGVGIGAGVVALAAAGAGAGVLSAQVGYSAAAGQNFDSGELAIAATVGGVAGGVKGTLTATGAGGTAAGTFVDGVAGAVQYGATEMYHGRSMDLGLAVESTAAGVVSAGVSGIVDEGFRAFSSPNNNLMWINTAANSQNWLSSSTTTYLARGALIEEAVSETLVSSTSELVNNFVDDYIDR